MSTQPPGWTSPDDGAPAEGGASPEEPGWGRPAPSAPPGQPTQPAPIQPPPPHPPQPPPAQAGTQPTPGGFPQYPSYPQYPQPGYGQYGQQPGYGQYGQQPGYGQYGQQPGWGQPPAWGAPPAGWGTTRPRPGIIPLRPISLGEIYDGAFQAIRTNPRTMMGFCALVNAVTVLLTSLPQAAALVSFGSSDIFDPDRAGTVEAGEVAGTLGGLFSALLVPAVLQALAITVVTGLLIVAVSAAVLGRRTQPGQLWARTRRRVPALIGLAILVLLAVALLIGILLVPGILLLIAGATVPGVVLLIVGILASIVCYLGLTYGWWALAPAALMLEDLPVIAALTRSWRLVRGSFWRVFGIMLLTAVVVGFLGGFISLPFSILASLLTVTQDQPYSSYGITLIQLMISNIGAIISGAVLYPFSAAVTALLYIDLRMRKEGLDVELMRSTESAGE